MPHEWSSGKNAGEMLDTGQARLGKKKQRGKKERDGGEVYGHKHYAGFTFQWRIHHHSMRELNDKPYIR